ncbi:peptide deformylase [Friedmanniella endophytica]|uniref:Peptide deformylase n=1 Tax=Microlunatus kandeliicorticis TaxID=1759536 RepID=A0A7W3IUV0_9ACTN|nr:peptide deformylase [Microlunatus kandeliicorticis]MBA8795698.1 peptide deformylase [Microlunatus kandeliicorticis]
MTIRRIRLFGDPVLRERAAPVVDFDAELRALVTDLVDTMVDADGGGIAAPQIGVGLRVFTYRLGDEIGHVVNPTVEFVGDEEQLAEEGCLSIPGLPFDCRRHLQVVTTGFTMDGEPLRLDGNGRLSQIIQHETDHLDGILFVDRLDPATRRAAEEAIRAAEWSGGVVPEIRVSPHAPLRPGGLHPGR